MIGLTGKRFVKLKVSEADSESETSPVYIEHKSTCESWKSWWAVYEIIAAGLKRSKK